MADPANLYAVLAEFNDARRLVAATRTLRQQGFAHLDAFTPFPVDGLAEALGFAGNAVPRLALIGGVVGGVLGAGIQVYANLAYPLWIGGRPVVAVPAFVLIAFVMAVLGATIAAVGGMFLLNRLPRLNHPMFEAKDFRFESRDRFFLAILADEGFDRDVAGKALAALHPRAIIDVPGVPTA